MRPTRVINLNKEPYDVYIGRGSKWGNPYTHISDKETLASHIVGSREEAMNKYREYLSNNQELLDSLHELDGKVIGCFCKPKSCHGDILIEFISKNKLKKFLGS